MADQDNLFYEFKDTPSVTLLPLDKVVLVVVESLSEAVVNNSNSEPEWHWCV